MKNFGLFDYHCIKIVSTEWLDNSRIRLESDVNESSQSKATRFYYPNSVSESQRYTLVLSHTVSEGYILIEFQIRS